MAERSPALTIGKPRVPFNDEVYGWCTRKAMSCRVGKAYLLPSAGGPALFLYYRKLNLLFHRINPVDQHPHPVA